MAVPSAFLDFDIVGNNEGVQGMLNAIDSAFSPAGLYAFFEGSVEPWVRQRAASRFAGEGDDVTGSWAPLEPATIEFRASMGVGPSPINRRTGELEEYIVNGGSDIVVTEGFGSFTFPGEPPGSASLENKVKTAQGGKSSPATVARPVLGLNERDLGAIMAQLAFYVQTAGRFGRAVPR